MLRRAAVVAIALSLAAPAVYADQPATNIRASIAKLTFDPQASSAPLPSPQRAQASRGSRHKAAVVAGLAVVGLYGGMFIASRLALPCGCDDPEAVVARGGLIGATAGAIAGVIITSR